MAILCCNYHLEKKRQGCVLALLLVMVSTSGCANFGDHVVVDPFFKTQMNMQSLNQLSPRDLGLNGLGPSCHPPSPRR